MFDNYVLDRMVEYIDLETLNNLYHVYPIAVFKEKRNRFDKLFSSQKKLNSTSTLISIRLEKFNIDLKDVLVADLTKFGHMMIDNIGHFLPKDNVVKIEHKLISTEIDDINNGNIFDNNIIMNISSTIYYIGKKPGLFINKSEINRSVKQSIPHDYLIVKTSFFHGS